MKDTIKGAAKSKMMYLAAALSLVEPILETLPEAKALLADHYGIAFVVLSGIVGLLRYLTTKPLSEK